VNQTKGDQWKVTAHGKQALKVKHERGLSKVGFHDLPGCLQSHSRVQEQASLR